MIVGQAPGLALIHGWGLGSSVWQPLLESLSASCRVHLVDLPGYGHAAGNPGDFAQAALNLIEALPETVTLCGWSLGALLAMRAALLAPQRVAGLVLVGATPCFAQRADWREAQAPALLDSFSASVEQQPAQTLQRFVALLSQGDRHARPITRALLASLRAQPMADAHSLQRGLGWLREVDLRSLLPSLGTRSLLIHGDRDSLIPCKVSSFLSQTLPNARLEVFAGAAHAPFLSDPDRFANLVSEFCHASSVA